MKAFAKGWSKAAEETHATPSSIEVTEKESRPSSIEVTENEESNDDRQSLNIMHNVSDEVFREALEEQRRQQEKQREERRLQREEQRRQREEQRRPLTSSERIFVCAGCCPSILSVLAHTKRTYRSQ